jgi:hypothetical protein
VDVGNPRAHRESAAMNGAQLLMAHSGSSGLMSGPPAGKSSNKQEKHTSVAKAHIFYSAFSARLKVVP